MKKLLADETLSLHFQEQALADDRELWCVRNGPKLMLFQASATGGVIDAALDGDDE